MAKQKLMQFKLLAPFATLAPKLKYKGEVNMKKYKEVEVMSIMDWVNRYVRCEDYIGYLSDSYA